MGWEKADYRGNQTLGFRASFPISIFSKGLESMRRLFHTWMGWVSSLGFILALGSCVSVEEMNVFRSSGLDMGCAVGSVTHNEAVVWVKTNGPQEVKILYTTDPL